MSDAATFGGRLWFGSGFWWFLGSDKDEAIKISCLIRAARYKSRVVARRLGVGERSFHRLVSDSLGVPPGLWLRMERAVAMRHRLNEKPSIKHLAAEFGFKHQGEFCTEFKRWYRVTPTEFMKRVPTRE